VALDARRGEVYCALYRRTAAALETLLPTDVRTPAQFQAELLGHQPLHSVVGCGFEAYPELLPADWPGPRHTSRRSSAPGGLLIARLTARAPERHQPACELAPRYHRRADIQVSAGGQ
jgi:tRNA A37 threonylcarbamoyladenosine modification protein TsaB